MSTLQALEKQRDKQLKLYQSAHRNHETLISMKRDQRNAYELEQARTQQKSLDDLFMARRHRIYAPVPKGCMSIATVPRPCIPPGNGEAERILQTMLGAWAQAR